MAPGEGVEQLEEDFSDVDSSDSENEDILKAFEPVVGPRSGKRTYGVLLDDVLSERRHKNAKLDEQLAFLRSILPGIHEGEERDSVLLDAFEHITRLQKSVDALRTELVPLCNPATLSAADLDEESLEEASAAQSTSAGSICVLYHHPMVVVKREEGKMEVQIACINRPGLLVDIMGALDSKRITVLHARIACRQNVLFEALTLEKAETLVLHAGPELLPKEVEDAALKDIIVRAIRQESSGNSSH